MFRATFYIDSYWFTRTVARIILLILLFTLILLVDRTDKHTKLEIDLIRITKYIYLTLTLYFNSATLKSRVYPTLDWASSRSHLFFRHHARAQLFSYISLIRSFFCPGISQTLHRSHHTTFILSLSPHSSFHTNIMYLHSSMATTTTNIIDFIIILLNISKLLVITAVALD